MQGTHRHESKQEVDERPVSSEFLKRNQQVDSAADPRFGDPSDEATSHDQSDIAPHDERADIVVAGSVALDLSCDHTPLDSSDIPESLQLQTSNPASITQSVGGVGHNVALAAHYFGGGDLKVKLCSVVGDDV